MSLTRCCERNRSKQSLSYSDTFIDFEISEKIKQIYLHLHHDITIYFWSDVCVSQFRLRYVFHLTTFFPEKFKVIIYCNVVLIFNFSRLLRIKNHSLLTGIIDQEISSILAAISTFRMAIILCRHLLVV